MGGKLGGRLPQPRELGVQPYLHDGPLECKCSLRRATLPTQVCNPIYMMRASRTATCELFLRQESRERLPEGGGFTEGQVSALMTFGVDALITFDDL